MDPACQYQQAAYSGDEDLLACSPLCSLLSPSCTADDTAWAGKFTLTGPGASGAVGCKRKAQGVDLTPCSSLANLTDCPRQGDRGGEYALTAPAFRHEAKRFHGSGLAGASPVKSDWDASSSSQQSEHDLQLLLHPHPSSAHAGGGVGAAAAPAPAAEADHSGLLLCCEEGLEMEEAAGMCAAAAAARQQRSAGSGECSPRSWDGNGSYVTDAKDGRCYSASTSDSQDSKGSSFVLASKMAHPDYDASSASPDDSCLLQPTTMSSTPSPTGNFIYRRIPEESLIGCMAAMYGFSPFTISVGTSYFERLAARDPALMAAARATPEFTAFVAATPVEHNPLQRPMGASHMHLGPKHWLTAVHLACIYIAAKNVEYVPYKKLLSTMLSHVHNQEVGANAAADLELEVVQALQWRLGPFFRPADTP